MLTAVVVAVVIAADALLAGRVEERAERELRAEVVEQTGGPPDGVDVSLRGLLAALRLLAGPAPGVTATVRGIDIPGTRGALTRLRVVLERVDADVGAAVSGSGARGSLPFTAGSGRFSAVLDGEDLAAAVGPAGMLGRVGIRGDAIVAVPGGASAAGEVPLAAALEGIRPGGASLVLTPAPGAPVNPMLAGSRITIPVVLPDALTLESVRVQDQRLVGRGRVDTELLTGTG